MEMECSRLLRKTTNSLVLIFFLVSTTLSLKFSQNYTGVAFFPFVCSKNDNGEFPDKTFYTPKHVRVMLQVISQKFSNVLAYPGAGMYFDDTHDNGIYAEAHTAEQAASINMEMGRRSLTILLGAWYISNEWADNELKLVIETAQRANNLYSGTVTGIVFSFYLKSSSKINARRSLKYFRIIKDSSDLEVGTIWKCDKLRKDLKSNSGDKNAFATFLKASDIIICNVEDEESISFEEIAKNLLRSRVTFKKLNPRIRVMARAKWRKLATNKSEELIKFKSYWKEFNNFAEQNEFPVYFDEAIENPSRIRDEDQPGRGWWKLSDNMKIGQITGYIEQAPDPYEISSAVKIVIVLCVVLGAAVLLIPVFKCVAIFAKFYIWANLLMDFQRGFEKKIKNQEDKHLCFKALKIPFDKSFEITNAQITFRKKYITHDGQIRSFHKAGVSSHEQSKVVALLKNKNVGGTDDMKEMLDEAKILMYLRGHPNIVTLEGVITESLFSGQVQVALELCNLGALDLYLRKHGAMQSVTHTGHASFPHSMCTDKPTPEHNALISAGGISLLQMMIWSHGIASGMDFLHSKKIIHGSLATSNVLLSFNKTAKITGFKLKRRIAECTKFIETGKQPSMWRWLSVESLRKCEFSVMSDVWSFGITMWEIFSMGALPYAQIYWTHEFVENLENGLRLKSPPHVTPELFQMMEQCWELQPNKRQKISIMKQQLQSIL